MQTLTFTSPLVTETLTNKVLFKKKIKKKNKKIIIKKIKKNKKKKI